MNRALALRALAIVIAIAAVVDPSFMREQRVRPEIALVASDATVSPALMQRVQAALEDDFSVIDGPFGGAAATVVVGTSVPEFPSFASPVFVVVPAPRTPDRRIVAVRSPATVSIDAVAGVDVDIEASGAPGDSVVVSLRHGATLMDRVARPIGGDARLTVPLAFVPTQPGRALLQASAEIVRGGGTAASPEAGTGAARAHVMSDVRDTRLRVLFHDARPSWMSTFVRRTLERDPRVSVTSRVVTSRSGISTDAGRPPALASLGATSPFDVIVLGAPESLTARDVEGVETFLRRRGGSVVFLLDGRTAGPYDRLMQSGGWATGAESEAVAITPTDSAVARSLSMVPGAVALRATEWVAPRSLPAGATAVLRVARQRGAAGVATSRRDEPSGGAVVWRTPVGAGTLLVSGALDAWRYRDSTSSAFGAFWSTVVAALGEAAIPPIALGLTPAVVKPGASVAVRASVRDRWDPRVREGLTTLSAYVSADSGAASLSSPGTPVRLWPAADAGFVEGSTRAPAAPGRYRVTVIAHGPGLDSLRADAELVVADSAVVPVPSSPALLALWARGHGGRAVPEASLASLGSALSGALVETWRVVPWHPMRSGWWIVPFAALLSVEWWIRRRHGLA
jgi:hypothetical protein